MKQEKLSPNYTCKVNDIIKVKMKKDKLIILKAKGKNSMGQWLIEQGISKVFHLLQMILKKSELAWIKNW